MGSGKNVLVAVGGSAKRTDSSFLTEYHSRRVDANITHTASFTNAPRDR